MGEHVGLEGLRPLEALLNLPPPILIDPSLPQIDLRPDPEVVDDRGPNNGWSAGRRRGINRTRSLEVGDWPEGSWRKISKRMREPG